MSKKKVRRRYTADQKAAILAELLFGKKKISEICDKHGIQPSVVYQWQKQAQENL